MSWEGPTWSEVCSIKTNVKPQLKTALKCFLKTALRLSGDIKQTGGLRIEGAHAFTSGKHRPGLVSSRQARECTIVIPPARGGGNCARGAHSQSSTAGFTKIRGSSTLLHRSFFAQCATALLPIPGTSPPPAPVYSPQKCHPRAQALQPTQRVPTLVPNPTHERQSGAHDALAQLKALGPKPLLIYLAGRAPPSLPHISRAAKSRYPNRTRCTITSRGTRHSGAPPAAHLCPNSTFQRPRLPYARPTCTHATQYQI